LMSGDLDLHHRLEAAAARLVGTEAALLFGSGFLANVGVIPALCGRHDLILADRLVHASILDGAALSRARLARFAHNDPGALEELLRREGSRARRALVVVESLYSMEGDRAPLADFAALRERYGFRLLVDEAHAVGV
ncbi:aminotransferase class I/II-fold pyridoxal phosphate-dependent enzyme, partial [Dissulfurirhabdus thermomarina]